MLTNKSDLYEESVINKEEGENYAKSINATFYETSAMDYESVSIAFEGLAKNMLKKNWRKKKKKKIKKEKKKKKKKLKLEASKHKEDKEKIKDKERKKGKWCILIFFFWKISI